MTAEERHLVSSGVLLLIALALGVLLHRSPDFAGSMTGSVLGIAGAALMVLPTLFYMLTKRVMFLKKHVTAVVSLNTLLGWHVYAGIAGSLLAMLHTGHKFNSIIGTLLAAVMLLTIFSGFVARYLVRSGASTIKEKKELLTALELQYRHVGSALTTMRGNEEDMPALAASSTVRSLPWTKTMPNRRARDLAASMAEVEYSIKMHDALGRLFRWSLRLHVVLAFAFLLLLGLHVWSGIYFGLRWLP